MKQHRMHLLICAGTGCVAAGSFEIKKALEKEIIKRKLQDEVAVISTGCNGFCERGPTMVVQPEGIFYIGLKTEDVPLPLTIMMPVSSFNIATATIFGCPCKVIQISPFLL
ncbi:unnamed protein product [marine sediment metagenome]|uniref:NADH-ubiquinone oxidoreductase 51kDa subunit FMN-binding domain-containing protein n=1 Tax=marine sediment metagenome TaxID=412755 RepID=X1ECH3_9ZZZZ